MLMTEKEQSKLIKGSKLAGVDSNLTLENGYLGDLKVGSVEVKLASTAEEIEAAQALRYRVFYKEYNIDPPPEVAATGLDADAMDEHCDHLLVIDRSLGDGANNVVGTYRLIRRSAAEACGHFYTSSEFNIEPLLAYKGQLLELGRSCVEVPYRTRPVMQLLWKGIASYIFHYNLDLMFGCASFHGLDQEEHQHALSYLMHNHMAPKALCPTMLDDAREEFKLLPKDQVDAKLALKQMPTIIKGYVRLGAYVGEGVFFDHELETIDVCIVLPTKNLSDKYFKHYERSTREAWAAAAPVED